MKNNSSTYQPALHTKWTVEIYGIFLMNQKTGNSCSLGYPQAAIWDLMTRDYPYAQIVLMLCAITSLQVNDVEELIAESLEKWTKSGFLTTRTRNG